MGTAVILLQTRPIRLLRRLNPASYGSAINPTASATGPSGQLAPQPARMNRGELGASPTRRFRNTDGFYRIGTVINAITVHVDFKFPVIQLQAFWGVG